MLKSNWEEHGEFELIRDLTHVESVWEHIEATIEQYWDRVIEAKQNKEPKGTFSLSQRVEEIVFQWFDKAIASYDKKAKPYLKTFDLEALEEFWDDPNAFKQCLARDVPVIAGTLQQQSSELKEWQIAFRTTAPADLLQMFINLIDFQSEWEAADRISSFLETGDPLELELRPLDEDEDCRIDGVIGCGIKSAVLFYRDCEHFPVRNRDGLYAFYFLTEQKAFDLPSESSEFLMVDDQGMDFRGFGMMEFNYWYEYDQYWLYAHRIYQWLSTRLSDWNIVVDDRRRFIYVNEFLKAVSKLHSEDIKTMRGHERFGNPM